MLDLQEDPPHGGSSFFHAGVPMLRRLDSRAGRCADDLMFQWLGVPAGLAAWTIQDLQAICLSGLSGYLSGSSGLACLVIRPVRLA